MTANECDIKECMFFELKKDKLGKYGYCSFYDDLINLNYHGDCNCPFYKHR